MKTRFIISAVLLGVSAIALAANETNEVSKHSIEPANFYGLIVNTNANIILSQGDENEIRVEGSKKDIKSIKAEVENGALVISGSGSKPVDIYVSAEELNLIEINGSARVLGKGSLNSDIMLLKVNGNGSMKVDVRALSVGMVVNGSGKIIVSGSCGESYSTIKGSGNIYSDKLQSFNNRIEKTEEVNTTSEKRSTLKLQK
jgi:hypothetical protein